VTVRAEGDIYSARPREPGFGFTRKRLDPTRFDGDRYYYNLIRHFVNHCNKRLRILLFNINRQVNIHGMQPGIQAEEKIKQKARGSPP